MIPDALCGEVRESFCAPDCEANKTECGDPAIATDEMPLHSSTSLCEIALKVLSRDSQLRRAYVQRRWQGKDAVVQKKFPGALRECRRGV